MDKKELQAQRMKGYFVQATKEILKGEGLRGISVRNVAEQAGYSYATLYNYFRDIKELIFVCVRDFQDECMEQIQLETANSSNGIEKIKNIIKSYTKYFIQYPGIFELFFIEGVSNISNSRANIKLIVTFLDKLCEEDWNYCVEKKILKKEEVDILKDQLNYTITGLLLFYLNRRYPDTYESFMTTIDKQLNHIFYNYEK